MGLIIDVYRHGTYDCTNDGVSKDHNSLTCVNVDGPFEPNDDRPAVLLVEGPGRGPNPIIVPAFQTAAGGYLPEPSQLMAGGNFASTSDSRFGDAIQAIGGVRGQAVKIHDRIES